MESIYFVSGLPRSGSTLIMNILGQNPKHHVTPSSGVVSLMLAAQRNWSKQLEFQSEGLEIVRPRIRTAMRGMIEGYFEEPLSQGRIIFDKSRAWLQYIEDLETIFDREVKIIMPVRDIRDILASFERLYRKRDVDYNYPIKEVYAQAQTTEDRCNVILAPQNVLGLSINRVHDAIQRLASRLVVIPFESLTNNPKETFEDLHERLGLDPFEYDFSNVNQITKEDDSYHGLDLHVIRPKVEPVESTFDEFLSKEYSDMIYEKYKSLNLLAKSNQ